MPLFTSHTLGSIVRKLAVKQKISMRRGGVKVTFAMINRRVAWSTERGASGTAGTVWEAAEQIEKLERR
jgi:hypothetical protein